MLHFLKFHQCLVRKDTSVSGWLHKTVQPVQWCKFLVNSVLLKTPLSRIPGSLVFTDTRNKLVAGCLNDQANEGMDMNQGKKEEGN